MLSSITGRIGRLLLALGTLAVAVGLAAAPASAYSHTNPTVDCTTFFDTSGRVVRRAVVPQTPAMFSGDYFTNIQIAYQPILHIWNGTSWQITASGNVSYGWSNNPPANTGFTVNTPNRYYAMSIKYWYFWNGAVAAFEWNYAGTHRAWNQLDGTLQYAQTGVGDYCYFGGTAAGARGKAKMKAPKPAKGSPAKQSRPRR
jgi:hypothetical protein